LAGVFLLSVLLIWREGGQFPTSRHDGWPWNPEETLFMVAAWKAALR
jgi:hypothetical protein